MTVDSASGLAAATAAAKKQSGTGCVEETCKTCSVELVLTIQRIKEWPKKPQAKTKNAQQGGTISTYELVDACSKEVLTSGFMLEAAGPSSKTSKSDQRILAGTFRLIKNPGSKGPFRLVQTSKSSATEVFGDRGLINIHVGNYPVDIEGCFLPGPDWDEMGVQELKDGSLDTSESYPSVKASSKDKVNELKKHIYKHGILTSNTTYDGVNAYSTSSYSNITVIVHEIVRTTYVLEVEILEPTGTTDGGRLGDFVYSGSLASHKRDSVKGLVGLYYDTEDETGSANKKNVVPKDSEFFAEHYGSQYFDISEEEYRDLKHLYIWSDDMQLSFFVNKGAGNSLATMRLIIPRSLASESSIDRHPRTGRPVGKGSVLIHFSAQVLESPVVFIRDEINKNASGGEIPTTNVGWWRKGQEGREWDYKHPIRRIWGDKLRLGNYAEAVGTGAFSNYHYGYVAAAGGFSEEKTLSISNWGQRLSTFSKDPDEDIYAISNGHAQFVANNGTLVNEKVHNWPLPDIELPTQQRIDKELELSSLSSFLQDYQSKWNAIR